jgi:capsular exopolysaccharide synthesis family protein
VKQEGPTLSQTQDRIADQGQHSKAVTRLTLLSNPDSAAAEAYRSLRASVKFAGVQPAIRSVLIADAGSSGQHSAVAANLAAALALGGDSVILIDANLRAPELHLQFGLPNESGLGNWLALGDPGAQIPLLKTSIDRLKLLTAGNVASHNFSGAAPVDYLGGDSFLGLMERLQQEADFLVFDAAPLSQVSDALAIVARIDAVILLVRSGRTKRAAAQRAKESLDRIGARVLGAVLTDTGGRFSLR